MEPFKLKPPKFKAFSKKVLCREQHVKPLEIVEPNSQENSLRFSVDRVDLSDWPPILNAIAKNRSLSKIHVWSKSHCKRIRERIDTEEKLVKLGRCRGKDQSWPIFYTNFLVRCLVDSIALHLGHSKRIVSVSLDGIPLMSSKYLNILCCGLTNNRTLRDLSLSGCKIGDAGCNLVLGSLRHNLKLSTLNLSSCSLTDKSAAFIYIFFKRKDKSFVENDEGGAGIINRADDSVQRSHFGLHTLILDKNRKFGIEGIKILAPVLRKGFLPLLSLEGCGITKEGINLIAVLLRENKALSENFSKNNVPKVLLRNSNARRTGELTDKRVPRQNEIPRAKMFKERFLNRTETNKAIVRWTNRLENTRKLRVQAAPPAKKKRKIKQDVNSTPALSLFQLESRLTQIQEFNNGLQAKLAINSEQLEHERQQTVIAENSYEEIKSRIKSLKRKDAALNRLQSKMLAESQLMTNMKLQLNDFVAASNMKLRFVKTVDVNILDV